MGLMSVGGSKVFSFKEAVMKIYKIGVIQAGVVMTQSSFQVYQSPIGQYVRNADKDFYAVKSGTFFIVTANAGLNLKTQIKSFSAGELMYTIQQDGDGVLILAL